VDREPVLAHACLLAGDRDVAHHLANRKQPHRRRRLAAGRRPIGAWPKLRFHLSYGIIPLPSRGLFSLFPFNIVSSVPVCVLAPRSVPVLAGVLGGEQVAEGIMARARISGGHSEFAKVADRSP
jgi:hypothetical protein